MHILRGLSGLFLAAKQQMLEGTNTGECSTGLILSLLKMFGHLLACLLLFHMEVVLLPSNQRLSKENILSVN